MGKNVEEVQEYVGGDSEEVEEVKETSTELTEKTIELECQSASSSSSDAESKSCCDQAEEEDSNQGEIKPDSEEIVETTKVVEESIEIDNSPSTSPDTNNEGNSDDVEETETIEQVVDGAELLA